MPGTLLGTDGNWIVGSRIGVGLEGTGSRGNGEDGIHLDGTAGVDVAHNHIESNVVANNRYGIVLEGVNALENSIQRNHAGVDITGGAIAGNLQAGIYLNVGANHNLVGPQNVVSGNGADGVYVRGATTTYNEVFENHVGTDVGGLVGLGNGANGVQLETARR